MAATIEVHLPPDADRAALARVLDLLADAGADDLELFEDERPPRLTLLFRGQSPEAARARAAAALAPYGGATLAAAEAEHLDSASTWAGRLRPFAVGPLTVVPAGHARPSDDFVLELDARDAFGSGLHATSALCLERLVELSPVESVLDVGTGTGILALAALRLGAERAVGTDTDARALARARANAERNGLETRLELVDASPAELGTFSLVVANIATSTLVQMARALLRPLGPRGVLLLSGIRSPEAEETGRAFRNLGLRWIARTDRDGWSLLELESSW